HAGTVRHRADLAPAIPCAGDRRSTRHEPWTTDAGQPLAAHEGALLPPFPAQAARTGPIRNRQPRIVARDRDDGALDLALPRLHSLHSARPCALASRSARRSHPWLPADG